MNKETLIAIVTAIIMVAMITVANSRDRAKYAEAKKSRQSYAQQREDKCWERDNRPCDEITPEQLQRNLDDFLEAATAEREKERTLR